MSGVAGGLVRGGEGRHPLFTLHYNIMLFPLKDKMNTCITRD